MPRFLIFLFCLVVFLLFGGNLALLQHADSAALVTAAQPETPCISDIEVQFYSCSDDACATNYFVSSGIVLQVRRTIDDASGDGTWSHVRLGNDYGYVHNLTCIPMDELWAEAQPRIDEYTAVLDADPADVEALYQRAMEYRELGAYEQALADFEAAIALDPYYGPAYAGRELIYGDMGRIWELMEQLVPTELPPEGLYDPGRAAEHIENLDKLLYFSRHWSLQIVGYYTFVPVPAGWRTADQISSGVLQYSQVDNYDAPDIRLWFSIIGYEGDDRTSTEAMEDLKGSLSEAGFTILTHELPDEYSGYLVFEATSDQGNVIRGVYGLAESLNDGYFHIAAAFVWDIDLWDDYYPAIQTIFDHLTSMDTAPAHIHLPDELSDLSAFVDAR